MGGGRDFRCLQRFDGDCFFAVEQRRCASLGSHGRSNGGTGGCVGRPHTPYELSASGFWVHGAMMVTPGEVGALRTLAARQIEWGIPRSGAAVEAGADVCAACPADGPPQG